MSPITAPRLVRLRTIAEDVAFVTVRAFASDRRSASLVAVLTFVLVLLPSAQVVATAALIDRLRQGELLDGLVWPLVIVVLVVGLSGPLLAAREAIAERSMLNTEIDLQSDLAAIVANMSPSRLSGATVAAEVEGHSRALIDAVANVYVVAMAGAGWVVSGLGVVATLAFMSPVAAALVVLAAAPAAITGKYVSRAIERMWHGLSAAYQRDRYLRDTMSRQRSITELASLGTTDRLAEMVSVEQHRVARLRDIPIAASIRAQFAVGASGIVLLGGAVIAVITGMGYGATAVAGIYGVIAAMAATSQGSLALSQLLQFLPQTTAVRNFFRAAPPAFHQVIAKHATALAVSGLSHRYDGRDRDAITQISLSGTRGEMIALVGVNGAGKTTTVNAILGLIEPTSGTVTVDGRKREEFDEAAWLAHFGLPRRSSAGTSSRSARRSPWARPMTWSPTSRSGQPSTPPAPASSSAPCPTV